MGAFDDAKNFASQHSEQADQAIEKGGDAVDSKTGGKYESQVDKGQDFLSDQVGGDQGGQGEQGQGGQQNEQ